MSEINNEINLNNNMKIMRPKIVLAEAPISIPKHKLFSEEESNIKIQKINTDIYENTNKEKSIHAFNFSLFFKIFTGVAITTAIFTNFDKIKHFFKR